MLAAALWPGFAHAEGLGLGEGTRWPDRNIFERVGLDVLALPVDAATSWELSDWATFAAVGGAVGMMMFAGDVSPDVRFDRWTAQHLDPHLPDVWAPSMQAVLWPSLAVGVLATWHHGWRSGNDHLAQGMSLMAEAVAVSQVYHLGLKLLIGREGPGDGSGLGRVLGPSASLGLYPAGTPSGHAATLFSLLGAGLSYFDPPVWAQVTAFTATSVLIGFHVLNHRHFASESLWGAALGYSVGRWVVQNRAAPARGAESVITDGKATSPPRKVTVAPLAVPEGGGLGLSGRF